MANSEQDFFDLYLKVNEDDRGELYDELNYFVEQFKEMTKPVSYPCIIIYSHYLYFFIYKREFDNFIEENDDEEGMI